MTKDSSGSVFGKFTGRALRAGWKDTNRALPWVEKTEADWSIL